MTPRSFWLIAIKLMGIYLVLDALTVMSQVIPAAFALFSDSGEPVLMTSLMLGALLLTLLIYYLILRVFLFKTDWIIDKLALDKHFAEEKFELNIHRTTVLRIAVIVIGGVMLVNALPSLCVQIFQYVQKCHHTSVYHNDPDVAWLILDLAKVLLGYALITNSRLLVNAVERRQRS